MDTWILAERGHSSEAWVFNKTMRYREAVVMLGETVAVVGTGRWEHDPEGTTKAGSGYRDAELPMPLVLDAPDAGPLLLSDQPAITR